MPTVEQKALRLTQQIYACIAEPARWIHLLAELARHTRAKGGLLRQVDFSNDQIQFSETLDYDTQYVQAYRDHYIHLDIYRQRLLHHPVGGLLTSLDPMSPAERSRTEYFNDYERPQDKIHVIGGVLARQGTHLTYMGLQRGKREGEFGARDKALLEMLLPHLGRALHLHELISHTHIALNHTEAVLDEIRLAVFITNRAARPLMHNAAADDLLHGGHVCRTSEGDLALPRKADTATLHRLIDTASAVTAGQSPSGGGEWVATSSSGQPILQIRVSPLPRYALQSSSPVPKACAAVFMTQPGAMRLPAQAIAAKYGLSAAEGRLVCLLSDGLNLEEAARTLSVSQHTVRSQLKSIFAKTGVGRQQELLLLLAGDLLNHCRGRDEPA
ncbi:MAG: helix-turn-helix transcriptional regulator [Pseudomonadota bacterium]